MSSWNRFSVAMNAALCAALALCLLTGCEVRGDDETRDSDRQTESTVIKLDGKGRQASEKFMLQGGLAVFEMTHDGDSNLIVRLLDQNGKEIETLFNQIGSFAGERGFSIPQGGKCLLDVTADGNWSVAIRQPRPEQGTSVPRTMAGKGFGITQFIQLDKGLNVFKMKHDGKDRFTVRLMDRDGRQIEPLINTLGSFSGSKPVSIEKPGIYFLNVAGDGDWTVEVE